MNLTEPNQETTYQKQYCDCTYGQENEVWKWTEDWFWVADRKCVVLAFVATRGTRLKVLWDSYSLQEEWDFILLHEENKWHQKPVTMLRKRSTYTVGRSMNWHKCYGAKSGVFSEG